MFLSWWPSRCPCRRLKLMRPPCKTAFLCPASTRAGLAYVRCEPASIARMPDPLLISSYISRRCPTRRVLRLGRKWHLRLLLKSTRGNFLVIPPRLVWRLFRCSRLAIRSRVRVASLRRCAPLTAQAFAAPLRCDGGSGGNDNSRGFIQVQNNLVSVIGFG